MTRAKTSGTKAVFWWVVWITLTILAFFAASAFWTPFIANNFGSVRENRYAAIWVAAVFGTWMVFLVPMIVLMYQKVDKAYEDARLRREKNAARFKSILVNRSERLLPARLTEKIKTWPETIPGGHLVRVTLKNGTEASLAFVAEGGEILGLYDKSSFDLKVHEIEEIEPADNQPLPSLFAPANWLRLDGVQPPG